MRNIELMITVFTLYMALSVIFSFAISPSPEEGAKTIVPPLTVETVEENPDVEVSKSSAWDMLLNIFKTFRDLISFGLTMGDPFINIFIGIPFRLIIGYVIMDEIRNFIPFVGGKS